MVTTNFQTTHRDTNDDLQKAAFLIGNNTEDPLAAKSAEKKGIMPQIVNRDISNLLQIMPTLLKLFTTALCEMKLQIGAQTQEHLLT